MENQTHRQQIAGIADPLIRQQTDGITPGEAAALAQMPEAATPDLLYAAFNVTRAFEKSDIFTCSIINAKSGRCSQDCAFCAQSAHHDTRVAIYPLMGMDEMVSRAMEMDRMGAGHFSMVTSGYGLDTSEIDTICAAAARIREKTGLTVCCSPGMLSKEHAEKLAASGVTHFHHNLETAKSYFPAVCSTHPYKEDIQALKTAAAAGLKVCTGGILGLGESWRQRIELAFDLKELNADRIPLNFLNPIAGTQMGDRSLMAPMEALKSIALFRLIHPRKDITICGGREATLGDYQSWVFLAGANGLMVGNYLTTRGRDGRTDMAMIRQWEALREASPGRRSR